MFTLEDLLLVTNFDTWVYIIDANTEELYAFGTIDELTRDEFEEHGLEYLLNRQVLFITVDTDDSNTPLTLYI